MPMNEYDYGFMYDAEVKKYLRSNEKRPVNKNNLFVLREINSKIDDSHNLIIRKFVLLAGLLKKIDYGKYRSWIGIMHSLKIQRSLLLVCKLKLKECGIDELQTKAIVFSLNKYIKRLHRIQNHLFQEYIEITPLKEFDEKLRNDDGKSIDILIMEKLDENDDESVLSPVFKEIIDDIMKFVDCSSYEQRLEEYNKECYKKIKEKKQRYRDEQNKILKTKAVHRLSVNSVLVRDKISTYRKGHNIDFDRLKKLKANGVMDVKIYIATKINTNASKIYYINKEGELKPSLHFAYIFELNEKPPKAVQDMVDNNQIEILDITFPT